MIVLSMLAGPVPARAAEWAELRVATLDGAHFDLKSQRGRWVIVNWWATWCAPCLKEMPLLSGFVADHGEVSAVGLTDEDMTEADLRKFLAARPVAYPIALVRPEANLKSFPSKRFGIQMRPLSYLVNPQGKVVKRFTGGFSIAQLETAIRDAGGKIGGATQPPQRPISVR